jgi:hypothetical protein
MNCLSRGDFGTCRRFVSPPSGKGSVPDATGAAGQHMRGMTGAALSRRGSRSSK